MAAAAVLVLSTAWPPLAAEGASQLDVPHLQPCAAEQAQPVPPARWRATYLMAPFTAGQLVLADVVQDALLSAMRVRLYGVERGALDLLVVGSRTYAIESDGPAVRSCRSMGDTGWRPWPNGLIGPAARCARTAAVGGINLDW
jgi:hypothetical protein